jgi:hypothetical protein
VLSVVTGLRTGQPEYHGSIPDKGKNFLFSKLALETTQITTNCVPGHLTPGVKPPGHEADPSPHLVPKLRKSATIPPLPICLHGM